MRCGFQSLNAPLTPQCPHALIGQDTQLCASNDNVSFTMQTNP